MSRKDRLANVQDETYNTFDELPRYWYTKEVSYASPIVVENVGGNNDFKDVSGWKAGVVFR